MTNLTLKSEAWMRDITLETLRFITIALAIYWPNFPWKNQYLPIFRLPETSTRDTTWQIELIDEPASWVTWLSHEMVSGLHITHYPLERVGDLTHCFPLSSAHFYIIHVIWYFREWATPPTCSEKALSTRGLDHIGLWNRFTLLLLASKLIYPLKLSLNNSVSFIIPGKSFAKTKLLSKT